jgi:hypothetical protein
VIFIQHRIKLYYQRSMKRNKSKTTHKILITHKIVIFQFLINENPHRNSIIWLTLIYPINKILSNKIIIQNHNFSLYPISILMFMTLSITNIFMWKIKNPSIIKLIKQSHITKLSEILSWPKLNNPKNLLYKTTNLEKFNTKFNLNYWINRN